MFCRKAELLKKVKCRTAVAEFIIYTDTLNRGRAIFAKASANCFAESADNVMLFNGDNLTCLFCRCNYKFFIKRLDCGNVNDFSIDALCFKSFACFNCFINHKSVCDDRYIAALFDNFAFADFKL